MAISLITLAGAATVLYFTIYFSIWVYKTFFFKSSSLKKYLGPQNWAGKVTTVTSLIFFIVVTGATAGIGEAFCEELAKRKTNLVIVARNMNKAKSLAERLEAKSGVKTKIVIIDYAKANEESFKSLADAIEGLEVTVLGISHMKIITHLL